MVVSHNQSFFITKAQSYCLKARPHSCSCTAIIAIDPRTSIKFTMPEPTCITFQPSYRLVCQPPSKPNNMHFPILIKRTLITIQCLKLANEAYKHKKRVILRVKLDNCAWTIRVKLSSLSIERFSKHSTALKQSISINTYLTLKFQQHLKPIRTLKWTLKHGTYY